MFAVLDDIYALTKPERTRDVHDLLAHNLFQYAGIRLHAGKTRTWNRAGEIPERMEEFGEDLWIPAGVKILGTPVGSLDFVESVTEERLEKEQELWRAIPSVPDLQCAWQ